MGTCNSRFLGQRGALLVLTSSPVRGPNFRKAVGLSLGLPWVTARWRELEHQLSLLLEHPPPPQTTRLCSFQTHPVPLRTWG